MFNFSWQQIETGCDYLYKKIIIDIFNELNKSLDSI